MRRINFVLVLPALSALMGCTNIRTVVTAFVAPEAEFKGRTFVVRPASSNKQDSLEARVYGDLIATELTKKQMLRVSEGTKADLTVVFDYEIDSGHLETVNYPVFIPGQTFVATTNSTATILSSRGSVSAYGTSTTVGTTTGTMTTATGVGMVYRRKFTLAIYAPTDAGSRKVYELSAMSNGSSGTFAEVAKPVIKAALSDFPDNAGEPDIVNTSVWRH